jgi:hypothetical protein
MQQALPIAGDGKRHLIHRNGNTSDIIRAISMADKLNAPYVADFAASIAGPTLEDTCYNLWRWIKDNIPYNEDPQGLQMVQSPGELYKNRTKESGGTGAGGDCKSYSNFISGCLKNLGVDHFYRFIAEYAGDDFHHVYICVPTGDGDYIVIDPTPAKQDDGTWRHPDFNEEYKFEEVKDVWAKGIARKSKPAVSGIGAKLGENKGVIVGPQNQMGYWTALVEDYKNNFAKHKEDVKQSCIRGVIYHWCGAGADTERPYHDTCPHPVKRTLFVENFEKNYDSFLHSAAAMAYHFWDAAKYGPLPAELQTKKEFGKEIYDSLRKLGLREGDLLMMCDIGIYMLYGAPLDYMYYRAKCLQLYGQPWEPVPGIPYFNVKTGALVNTGTTAESLALTIKIGFCFPWNGGVGRPEGVPFWTHGGFVMPNGAIEKEVRHFVNTNPRPEETKVNNLTTAQIAEYTGLYIEWMNGNMVGLPDVLSLGTRLKGNKIGVGYMPVAEIIAIVTAVVTALGVIAGIVAKILAETKKNHGSSRIPEFKQDFKEMYQTVDGCTMFQNTQGQLMKCCPDGNCMDNPNPNDPANQAAAGGFGGIGSPKMLLFLGAGLLGLGFVMSDNSKS